MHKFLKYDLTKTTQRKEYNKGSAILYNKTNSEVYIYSKYTMIVKKF